MTQAWRIRISGKQRKEPDITLLVQAVLALSEQLQREAQERDQQAKHDDHPPSTEGADAA